MDHPTGVLDRAAWRRSVGTFLLATFGVLTLGSLFACATLVSGSSQNVTITTDPAGASCIFRRNDQVIGVINPTPGTLNVEKSRGDIAVACTKDGYLDSKGVVGSKFQAMTFGNILFGGLVGVVVDAPSGATSQYEPQITIRLIPAEFSSAAERDAFFARMRSGFLKEAQDVKARIANVCSQQDCKRQLDAADEETARGLQRLEQERTEAKIRG